MTKAPWVAIFFGSSYLACSPGATPTAYAASETCASYCAMSVMYCTNGSELFQNPNDCPAVCASYNATGIAGDTNGNTLQCRLTYLFAAHEQTTAFCLNAAPQSPVCQ